MKTLARLFFAGFSIGGVAAGLTLPAHAELQFTVGVQGTEASFTCVDNAACDTSSATGVINIPSISFGGLTATNVVVTSTGNQDDDNAPSLSYSIGSFTNDSGQTLVANFALSDTNFPGGTAGNLNLDGHAAWTNAGNSNVVIRWFVDTDNAQGGNTPTDAPGMEIEDDEFSASSGDQSFTTSTPIPGSGQYSLSDSGTLTLVDGGTISGGQSTVFSPASSPVPEPSTWAMMAIGFAGLGFVGYKQARRPLATI
jgi:hypothetical protein